MAPDDPLKVLYIGGFGRSGSTLLDGILHEAEGFESVGEVMYLWQRGVEANELCGCGTPFHECQRWHRVLRNAYDAPMEELEEHGLEMATLRQRVDRVVRLPRTLWGRSGTQHQRDVDRYVADRAALYHAVADETGARVIVDSSKIPSTPYLLQRDPSLDVTTVHLVRDPRAVAHSWSRRKRRPEIHWKDAYMPTAGPTKVAKEWLIHNTFMEPLARGDGGHVRLRYEDLAQRPAEAVDRVLEAVGEDVDNPVTGRTVTFHGNHTVAGNPLRFKTGDIEIRLDDRWRRNIDARRKHVVTALTWPGMLRYGYPIPPQEDA